MSVPEVGALVGCMQRLRPIFGSLLVEGEEVTDAGQRCVRWDIGDREAVRPSDPRHAGAVGSIRDAVARASRGAEALRAILDAKPRAQQVELGPDVMAALGRRAEGVRLARRDVAAWAEILRLGSLAVEHALRRGSLWADESGVRLSGWGFLPPEALSLPSSALTVALQALRDGESHRAWRLEWSTEGPAEDVHLVRRMGDDEEVVLRDARVREHRDRGAWSLTGEELPPGCRVRAVATGPGCYAASPFVDIEAEPAPTVPVAPAPAPFSTPPAQTPVAPASAPDPRPATRRRWPWLFLALLLALALLAWLWWLLFPGSAHSHRQRIEAASPVLPDWASLREPEDEGIPYREIDVGPAPAPERVLIWVAPRAGGER